MPKKITFTGVDGLQISLDTGLFIDNAFVDAVGGTTLDTENPSTGAHLATVAAAEATDVDIAVASSLKAFRAWRKESPATRRQLLHKFADLLERDAATISSLESLDAGTLFRDSTMLNVSQALENLRYFAGWADKVDGLALGIPEGFSYVKREPFGVCAAIVPWNSPLMITIWKLAPCIAAGNTLVIKTPELCPLYGIHLASLVAEAGFPPGVINIITGFGKTAGQRLAEHPDIRKLSFTGSPLTGRSILAVSARTNLKKVTLELGGKGASIVFDDADLENALFWTTLGITANNGQICVAGSRIYVQDTIYEKFILEFSKRSRDAVQGDPLLSSTTKGPVISAGQREKILAYVDKGRQSSARLLHGDSREGHPSPTKGHFVPNVAFADVPQDAVIMQEEVFGPLASIASFNSDAEVIEKANGTSYGLGAAIFTTSLDRALRVTDELEAGQVTVNMWGTVNANTPFGGIKESGFGRDMGEEALKDWTVTKAVKFFVPGLRG